MDKMITFYMNFPLFEEMSKEIIFTVVTRSRFSKVASKHTVVKQGDVPKSVYFIRNGKLRIVKEMKLPMSREDQLKSKMTIKEDGSRQKQMV
mmetsp:Transcript_13568/g.13311  ORF Transcript_13568/g.13311 Transcript_13568/m.13311 type:complete len:92 (+) Transcript_13568:581-856(+)